MPLPHWAVDVHAMTAHVIPVQVPLPQSALPPHSHCPPTHARPEPQSLFFAHVVSAHDPMVAPEQANVVLGQSPLDPQGSLH